MIFAIQQSISCRGAVLAGSVLASILAVACGGGGSSNPGNANAYITNANNYTSVSSLNIPATATAPGADLHICWTSLGTDLLGHPISPATDIDHVTFLQVVGLTKDAIAKQFAAGTFATKSVKLFRDYVVNDAAGETCAQLSAFKLGGAVMDPAQDYAVAADKIYLLLFAKGTTPGVGSKSMMFLEPSASSTNVEVTAPEGKTILNFQADLTTPKPVNIPAAGPFVVDWSQLTTDGMGNPVVYQKIDSLLVGYYDGMTVAQLQARCLDFDLIATTLYRVGIPIGPKQADLTTAVTENGGIPFAGFTPNNGVWAVGLMCSECQVPAPIAVAILNPQ
jgi:hypothetical protein